MEGRGAGEGALAALGLVFASGINPARKGCRETPQRGGEQQASRYPDTQDADGRFAGSRQRGEKAESQRGRRPRSAATRGCVAGVCALGELVTGDALPDQGASSGGQTTLFCR